MLKIALAQFDVLAGQPTRNFERMKAWIQQAKQDQADLIIFPELSLTGYILGDQWTDQSWVEFASSFNDKIKQLSQGIGIIWGNVTTLDNLVNHDGRIAKVNAAFFAFDGQWINRSNLFFPGMYVKHLQPNYRIFDESRHFLSGNEVAQRFHQPPLALLEPFEFKLNGKVYRLALEICEDLWDDHYPIQINAHHVTNHVDMVVNLSASPWTLEKEQSRQKQVSRLLGVPLIYVNRTGVENNGKNIIVYDGGSFIYNAQGVLTHSLNQLGEPELQTIQLDKPLLIEKPKHKLYSMLIKGIQYVHHEILGGHLKWVVGLSGGIDSAVSTALLAAAIGPEKIHAYSLPTKFNSSLTQSNAQTIAKNLGIHFKELPIQSMVDFLMNPSSAEAHTSLELENIQARVRGMVLMNEAQRLGAVVLNNGNKIEIALGYATLYGDTIGAVSPLGDLTKMQIIELAESINSMAEQSIIPLNLIPSIKEGIPYFDMPPSAELKSHQIDPMKWGYHDWLIQTLMSFPSLAMERILTMFLHKKFPTPIQHYLRHYQLDSGASFIADLEWVSRSITNGVFKRIQLPPIILVSRGAFGFDYRESQMKFETTQSYKTLRDAVMSSHY